jgi:hypothetical protein
MTVTRLVRYAHYSTFQLAEAARPRKVFTGILRLFNGLRAPPAEATCS